jgi:chromosome segregation ATPase
MTIREQISLENKKIKELRAEICTISASVDKLEIEILEIKRKAEEETRSRKYKIIKLLERKKEFYQEIESINQKIDDLKSQI